MAFCHKKYNNNLHIIYNRLLIFTAVRIYYLSVNTSTRAKRERASHSPVITTATETNKQSVNKMWLTP